MNLLGITNINLINSIKHKINVTKKQVLLKTTLPILKYPFHMRVPSSDFPTFQQIFINQEYDFSVIREPKLIFDAGANIGLAAIYFANKYPNSQIIAIEPDKDNFALLQMNVASYANIIPLYAALWYKNDIIDLIDPGLGKWGYMTLELSNSDKKQQIKNQVQGLTVNTIMQKYSVEHIDIMKIDIEGAEKEVFSNSYLWLDKVDAIIIELHERMKSGTNRSFYNGSNGFDYEWQKGENIYLSRKKSCINHF